MFVWLSGPIEIMELVYLDGGTGEMVVAGKIDRERYPWINLTAKASDSGSPTRTSFVPVHIQVNFLQ
jgi:cadherin 23